MEEETLSSVSEGQFAAMVLSASSVMFVEARVSVAVYQRGNAVAQDAPYETVRYFSLSSSQS